MKKLSRSLGCAVLNLAVLLSGQSAAAAIFPAQGEDTMSSMGVFRVLVAPAFRPLLAPNVGFSGYPGYSSADGRLTSPSLIDLATTVGRSAPHDRPLVGSLPVGLPSMGNVGYADYPAIPALFGGAPPPTREILTQIRSFALETLRKSCPSNSDPRVPSVPLNWVMVKAGPNQGVALKSIGMVQENAPNGAANPDFPARSFFDIFVEVSLPPVPGTVSSTAFPALGADLFNSSPLIITNLNLSSLPPNVIYIHGETTAVPLRFKNNNAPYWSAGEVFGFLVLAGHGTQADCTSESAFLDAVLGPIGGPQRPELPIEWPFPSPRCPPTNSTYDSVRNVDIVNFGFLRVRNFVHSNLINPIPPPPLGNPATYSRPNTQVTLEASNDEGETWFPAQATGLVAVGINHISDSGNTGNYNTEMFQLNLNGGGPSGPFMIRESPTLASMGKHTIRTNPPDYFVGGFFDVFLELSPDNGATWIPANRSIRVQLTPPPTPAAIPMDVSCPPDITVTATSAAGAVVTYISSASGGCSPPVVNCNPPSGSTFPIGTTTVTCTASDSCGNTATCSFKVTVKPPVGNPCLEPDNGNGTVTLPPAGCHYLSPDQVHMIINGLPPGTTIELAAIHKDFICRSVGVGGVCSFTSPICREPGGILDGEKECSDSTLQLNLKGTGELAGFLRQMNIPVGFETHVGPRTPGQPVQSFNTAIFRLSGQIEGDPDFDLLRITAGTDYGLPSPGHTTLTRQGPPGSNWAVDSFFDITYRIDFVGKPGGVLGGVSGSTTGTIRMVAVRPPPIEVDYFPNTTAQVTLQKPGGATETVNLTGPTEVHVMIAPNGSDPGVIDSNGNGRDEVETKMVLMNLSGNSSMGPVTVNLNSNLPTAGQIEETTNSNPGRVDVAPFTPGGTAISTFAVYIEVRVGSQVLHNAKAIHMESLIHHKPPRPGDEYVNPFTAPIPLLDANGNPTGFSLLREVHTPNPTPIEVDYFSNTTAQVTLQKPGGATETVNLSGPTEVHVMIAPDGTGPAVADTDADGREQVPTRMLLMSLTGNSSMGPVTVNLNPNVPTVGQIEESANPNPGRLDVAPFTPNGTAVSTFGVYLVVQVGGQTLHNTQAIHMESLIHHKPPRPGDEYVNPFTAPIPLLDANGNPTGFSLLQEVHTPNPTNPPLMAVTCSSDITVTATSAAGAVVSYTSSAKSGCPPVTLNCNPPSGSTFPVGTTTVICTASDACGQTATCTFSVTVNSPEQINLTCSPDITVIAKGAAGAVVNYTSSATGGCPPVNLVCHPPSGSTFPIGTTTVTCIATNACGQSATCSFKVTVARPPIVIRVIGNQLQVIWTDGTLQQADQLEGPYIDVDPQPPSPLTIPPIGTKKFFRVRTGGPGFTFYDTEMLQLDISGGGLPTGMMIRESPTQASTGKTAISPAADGGFVIDSFFDVFTDLSMNGGQTWQASTGAPPRMRFTGNAPANTLPPREANYISPADWHALYAQGIYITNASHSFFTGSFPPPPPGGATDTHSFGSTVNMLVRPCPTCPFQPVSAPAQVTVKVTSRPDPAAR